MRTPGQIDMNLLVLFEALLDERHLTRAAIRIGMAQPSASKALGHLRHLFGDPLFVRSQGVMRPTARALEIAPEVAALLAHARALLSERTAFDPTAARALIRVAMSDAAEFVVLPMLIARMLAEAPGIDLRARPLDKNRAFEDLDAGRLDAVIGVFKDWPKRLGAAPLFEERFACLARVDHPALHDGLTLEAFASLPHLLITLRDDARGAVDEALARLGRSRRIAATLTRFLAVPRTLVASDAIATVPARFAAAAVEQGCRMYEPPLPLPRWTEQILWARSTERELLGAWFRRLVIEVARSA